MSKHTLTLQYQAVEDWVSGGELGELDATAVQHYVNHYKSLVQQELGSDWDVITSGDVLEDQIDGMGFRHAENELVDAVRDAMEVSTLENWEDQRMTERNERYANEGRRL